MRTRRLLFWAVNGIALMLVMLGMMSSEVEAKKVKKLTTEKYKTVCVECRKTYKISKIAQVAKHEETGFTLLEDTKRKKVKWSTPSKKVIIKKKTFRVKKQGNYRLIGKTKKRKYVLPILAVERKRNKDYSQVAYARIGYGKTFEYVTINNAIEVAEICKKINEAQYIFDEEATRGRNIGWTFRILLYSADGKEIDDLTTGLTSDDPVYYKCKNPDVLLSYITTLYNIYYYTRGATAQN